MRRIQRGDVGTFRLVSAHRTARATAGLGASRAVGRTRGWGKLDRSQSNHPTGATSSANVTSA